MVDVLGLDEQSPTAAPARLTEFVHRTLWDRIIRGEYPRKTRLPSERELAMEFDVSRPVIRAALAHLRGAGLVQSIKGSGSIVVHDAGFPASPPQGGATVRDLQRCFEFRLLIEGEAAHHAASRAAPSSLADIRKALDACDEARLQGQFERGQSFDFHRAVAVASDNPFYVESLVQISRFTAFRIYLGRSFGVPDEDARLAKVSAEHRHILDLIERREPEEAKRAMRLHIERARDSFMECLPLGGSLRRDP
jgi:DNA-binding FadR family transcriptional regulator